MAFTLFDLLADWENIGFFHVALPFLLVFTLVFAILQKTKILGSDSKNFNAIVALIIGALVVRNQDIVFLIQRFLPNISMFVVIALMLLLLIGIFGGKHFSGFTGGWLGAVAVVSLFVVGWALTTDFLFAPFWLQEIFWLEDLGILTTIGIGALVIFLIFKEPKEDRSPGKQVLDWFKGGDNG